VTEGLLDTAGSTDPILFSFFNEVNIIAQLSTNAFGRALPSGMSVSQFSVLNHLVRLGDGKNPSRLANAFQVTKGAMTNTLSKLEKRGFIELRVDEDDGRGKRAYLTDAGKAARVEGLKSLEPELFKVISGFDVEEFSAALPFLQKVRSFLDAARD
jgi:DNA-binding MarR family transcriptional regulator